MEREELNTVLDALLSLSDEAEQRRKDLIELGFYHSDWPAFVAEWLWLNQKSIDAALFLKVWLGWSYHELGEVFGLDFREVAQLLRTQRVQRLGSYPQVSREDLPQYGGISCFMVEQQLSSWIDSAWEESLGLEKIYEHLKACRSCHNRLEAYRHQHQQILLDRKSFASISTEEWSEVAGKVKSEKRKRRFQWISIFLICVAFAAIILWMLKSQPEKMPNIYEIKEI